ncbi:MAG: 50S ribosomal protein L10 [Gemmatimonadetes bacterium]|jgi:large subunit ribosomal protein L10|nr:50S ribosomal protein L10 [Gemmatimonadota bacterium]MBT4611706.1 50S ribosomal protein L10 [Gemmatimonadota bacterium]MBT5055671.1 50S ribosomal protein L10 [Gemmatimonadota bacterium]MBT5143834.1 50S ribosomal protein L10 [Gemmatimonadota bacterium]MBT5590601.1 50S ribosomal protein L10 [Gemmatimonadota bacterium]
MPTVQKVDAVSSLSQKMTGAGAIFLADFSGIDVASVTELRRSLRKAGIEYQVVKNRLAKLAASESGLDVLNEHFEGPTAMAFAGDDPVEPAKLLQKFIDDGGKLSIKTGLVDGQVLTPEAVGELAKLPSRDELIGKLVGTVNAPLYGLAAVLNGLLRNLVGVLGAIEKEKSGGADAAGE